MSKWLSKMSSTLIQWGMTGLPFFARWIESFWIPANARIWRLSSKKLRSGRSLTKKMTSPVGFFPYDTPACRFQHTALSQDLVSNGLSAIVMTEPIRANWLIAPDESLGLEFSSLSDLRSKIVDLCGGDPIFARGAIDEFFRVCSVDVLFGPFNLDPEFIRKIAAVRSASEELVSSLSGIVVADGAYMINSALISAAIGSNKPVFVFNPSADWLQVSRSHNEFFRDHERALSIVLQGDSSTALEGANAYLGSRFSGLQKDLDSPKAFSKIARRQEAGPRKVLFLHVSRDASFIPVGTQQEVQPAFGSYFEWADFCLCEISKNPKDWYVKFHPSSEVYPGEAEIQQRLLAKLGLGKAIAEECPSTLSILENRWPVYTHSGTVGLETAVFGYRAFVCSNKYPTEIVSVSHSRDELLSHLNLPFALASPGLDINQINKAKLLLYFRSVGDVPTLSPKKPHPDRRTSATFLTSLIGQEFSLIGRYLRFTTRARLHEIAEELANEVLRSHRPE